MKKIGTLLSLLGILLIAIFALLDYIEPGNGVKLGSAQLLGIESGIGFVLLGAGLLLTSRNREIQVGNSLRLGIAHILNLSPVKALDLSMVLYYTTIRKTGAKNELP